MEFMDLFEPANNCSKSLIVSALIPLVSPICGPETHIECQKGAFKTSLNTLFGITIKQATHLETALIREDFY